ncbi:MAG TPA: glycine zipper 2TM domain-containing protein [Steroidobacteraceae bacterium]|nr:glycine zipper 2TM domain-containing protein [Steroidobacteraceae bacterium]
MNNDVASALRGLYAKFGDQLLTQPPRLASLLRDECPTHRPEISAVVKALEEQVPQDLLNSRSGEPPRSLAARLAKRLSEEHLLAREASNWAVWAWAHGLGLGDEYRNEEPAQEPPRSIVVEPRPLGGSGALGGGGALEAAEVPPQPAPRRPQWVVWAGVAAIAVAALGYGGAEAYRKMTPPPHIATIDVPNRIRVGQPYTFAIHFDKAKGGVVAIERHVVESSIQWAQEGNDLKVSGMENQTQGTIQYAFDPESKPSKNTLQFVLIDRNGHRSEPQTVSYEVTPMPVVCNNCGTIADIQRIDEKRKPKGAGAAVGAVIGGIVGSLFGHGGGKVAATTAGAVGGGVAGNAIEGRMTASHWNVTVKLNSGRRQTIELASEPDWHVGQKVKLVNGEIVAL